MHLTKEYIIKALNDFMKVNKFYDVETKTIKSEKCLFKIFGFELFNKVQTKDIFILKSKKLTKEELKYISKYAYDFIYIFLPIYFLPKEIIILQDNPIRKITIDVKVNNG